MRIIAEVDSPAPVRLPPNMLLNGQMNGSPQDSASHTLGSRRRDYDIQWAIVASIPPDQHGPPLSVRYFGIQSNSSRVLDPPRRIVLCTRRYVHALLDECTHSRWLTRRPPERVPMREIAVRLTPETPDFAKLPLPHAAVPPELYRNVLITAPFWKPLDIRPSVGTLHQ